MTGDLQDRGCALFTREWPTRGIQAPHGLVLSGAVMLVLGVPFRLAAGGFWVGGVLTLDNTHLGWEPGGDPFADMYRAKKDRVSFRSAFEDIRSVVNSPSERRGSGLDGIGRELCVATEEAQVIVGFRKAAAAERARRFADKLKENCPQAMVT